MKRWLATMLLLVLTTSAFAADGREAKVLPKALALPLALSDDFEFRKEKLYTLADHPPAPTQDASINFERQYRLFGAVTRLDQGQRFGNYFDFYWRAKRPANLTVRLEYRQEKLRSAVQAREVAYPEGRGHHQTSFSITGDDYFDFGRVIAWRCLLIEHGRIVALTRSYLWE